MCPCSLLLILRRSWSSSRTLFRDYVTRQMSGDLVNLVPRVSHLTAPWSWSKRERWKTLETRLRLRSKKKLAANIAQRIFLSRHKGFRFSKISSFPLEIIYLGALSRVKWHVHALADTSPVSEVFSRETNGYESPAPCASFASSFCRGTN